MSDVTKALAERLEQMQRDGIAWVSTVAAARMAHDSATLAAYQQAPCSCSLIDRVKQHLLDTAEPCETADNIDALMERLLPALSSAPQPQQAEAQPAVLVSGATLYELNAAGTNRWWATVYAGHDDEGKQLSDAELQSIVSRLAAVPQPQQAEAQPVAFAKDVGWAEAKGRRPPEAQCTRPGAAPQPKQARDWRYSRADLEKIADDKGPFFAGNARQALRWASDVLEAADQAVKACGGQHSQPQQARAAQPRELSDSELDAVMPEPDLAEVPHELWGQNVQSDAWIKSSVRKAMRAALALIWSTK